MIKISLSILALSLLPSAAAANWDVQKSEEDVFGNINVTVSAYGDNGSLLRFECGSSNEPRFVYLIRDNSGDIPEFEATFYHVDQDRNRGSSPATLMSWNENYIAVKVSEFAMLRRVADHMVVASRSIPVGIEVPVLELKLSDTFSPRGSTAAGKAILEHCVAPEPTTQITPPSSKAPAPTTGQPSRAVNAWNASDRVLTYGTTLD